MSRLVVVYAVWIVTVVLGVALPSGSAAQPSPPDALFANGFEMPNQAPIADPGNDQTTSVGSPLTLDGSGSSDPDSDPLSFAWSIVERPTNSGTELFHADLADPVFIPDRAGVYVVQLVVSDGNLFSAPATIEVTATGALASSAMIGPTGGAVGLPDGAGVLVPPGALDTVTTIGIAEIPPPPDAILPPTAVYAGAVYQLTPQGQSFVEPVQIVIPYDPALLPAGYEESSVGIYRRSSGRPEFNMAASYDSDPDPDGHGQRIDTANKLLSVSSVVFSDWVALAGVRSVSDFQPVSLSTATASITVRRPPVLRTQRPNHHNCVRQTPTVPVSDHTQGNLPTRAASAVATIVLHSTNSGNAGRRTIERDLAWAGDECNQSFAHYYIDRSGTIYQVVDDLTVSFHAGVTPLPPSGILNANAIGIELLLNVGEPYDGRQLSALIRLVDYLAETYAIERPSRDPATGLFRRNRGPISAGGDRIVAHSEVNTNKCDPSGTFMDSGIIKPENGGIACKTSDPRVQAVQSSVGSSLAPALVDMVTDAIAVLRREDQHTGIVNTQGGDAFELNQAGNGGAVTLKEDAALVDSEVGTAERTHWQENDPNLTGQPPGTPIGPGPLIVAPGATVNLSGPTLDYTDVIIAGTLNVTGSLELRLTGSFYISPIGKLVIRDGRNGGNLTVYSRGVPVIQGLIDARGEAGVAATPDGGTGGQVKFIHAAPGILLLPTLYTRGGDADFANVTLPGGGPKGGNGGAVEIAVTDSHVFLGGGLGKYVNDRQLPPLWFVGTVDAQLFVPHPVQGPRWAGDYLPPTPPLTRYSLGTTFPPGQGFRVPKRAGLTQPGFIRGLVTTGGMGGAGVATSDGNQHGGDAGNGGSILIDLGSSGVLTFRDIDVATGTEIGTLTHRFNLPPPDPAGPYSTCTSSGAHGGFGQLLSGASAGNGGAGGMAGAISIAGGTFNPSPSNFAERYTILEFPPTRLQQVFCTPGTQTVGNVIEAFDAGNRPLYRVRVNTTRTALLGGKGGIPSGRIAGYPGDVGPAGANAPIVGLPVQ